MGGFAFADLHVLLFCSFILVTFFTRISFSVDTLSVTQSLGINQTLVSPMEVFELGFFSSSNSRWYLGIWYKNIPDRTVVWVANRDTSLENSTGILKIGDRGNIVLDQAGNLIWSSTSQTAATNPVLQLLDSGNLILREANEKDPTKYLWQSFDYPTDTLLPGMKIGWNLDTGLERNITSWRSIDDPSTGDVSFKLDFHGFPEIFLVNKQERVFRTGPWNGQRFSGLPMLQDTTNVRDIFTADSNGVYYTLLTGNQSLLSRLTVNSTGEIKRLAWLESSQSWNELWSAPRDQCDQYGQCGPYGICNTNDYPACKCVQGFRPRNQLEWDLKEWFDGCVRNTELDCGNDKFLKVEHIKLPDTTSVFVNKSMTLEECEGLCFENCSCTAYANAEITNRGAGCVMWTGELLDTRQFPIGGQELYVRLAASELGDLGSTGGSTKAKVIIGITVGAAIILLGVSIYILWKKKKLQIIWKKKKTEQKQKDASGRSQDLLLTEVKFTNNREHSGERNMDDLQELPLFDFSTIKMATDNFSEANKLGEGGFGCVYRGRLLEGQDIAVKRLSESSGQGVEQFKNEVKLLVKLQHRNLVRLYGCCIEMNEKMLVYEYMENNSLNSILFDKSKSSILNWQRRFNIICGIARGLLYLHQDSRLKIIHRDLKGSNILLDEEMNPKISDFGMARIFNKDQTEQNTIRVVGTYGYMSPEYAMDGLISMKSDVFSFGVLVLEIISGNKNKGFYYSDSELNLLGHAWMLWNKGSALEMLDSSMGDSYSAAEVLICIQVGLLCVQELAEDRPTMSSVVLMLSSETASMQQPKGPGFSLGRKPTENDSSSSKQEPNTANHVTVTIIDPR